jgi:hypothetical protein
MHRPSQLVTHLTQDFLSGMLGPMLSNPKIASACSGSVKRAGAAE